MSRESFRRAGAIAGLVVGIVSMRVAGHAGLLAAFLFGAGGTVIGGMLGERIYESRPGK